MWEKQLSEGRSASTRSYIRTSTTATPRAGGPSFSFRDGREKKHSSGRKRNLDRQTGQDAAALDIAVDDNVPCTWSSAKMCQCCTRRTEGCRVKERRRACDRAIRSAELWSPEGGWKRMQDGAYTDGTRARARKERGRRSDDARSVSVGIGKGKGGRGGQRKGKGKRSEYTTEGGGKGLGGAHEWTMDGREKRQYVDAGRTRCNAPRRRRACVFESWRVSACSRVMRILRLMKS